MTHLQIAPTTQDDLPAILDMAGETFRAHQARHAAAFPEVILYKIEEMHRDAVDLAGNTPTSFSATRDGALAGYVLLRTMRGGAITYDIGVLPGHRRRGIGQALLGISGTIAKRRGWRRLVATVWAGNAASHGMFRKAGFTPEHLVPLRLERHSLKPTKTTYRKIIR